VNDDTTPEMSARKIKELEGGNAEQKLMAAFARHVIKPGRYNYSSRWVSKRSLERAFPEHFDNNGFLANSTWRNRVAKDFGLPRLFLRGVDQRTALVGPRESLAHMMKDLGHAPDVAGLTRDEYSRLRKRHNHDNQGSLVNAQKPRTYSTPICAKHKGVVKETGLDAGEDSKNSSHLSGRIRSRKPLRKQNVPSKSDTPASTYPEVTPSRDLTASVKVETIETVQSEHKTPSHGLGLKIPRTEPMESDHSHAVLQQDNVQYQKEQAATMGEPNESRESPLANDTRAITQELIPKIYDILKDFPTAPDDESFLPLLRRLVKATATNLPRVMEEAYLDLSTHVVMQCPDTSSTNQVETASLVRPVLRILFRHRQRMVRDTHSQLQLEVSSAAKANDLNKLCDIYAQLLILEAHHEESQVGQ
jgi:hypothetical protein